MANQIIPPLQAAAEMLKAIKRQAATLPEQQRPAFLREMFRAISNCG